MDDTELLKQARQVLDVNDMGIWTLPTSNGLYPHQWLWDAFFIAIGQRWYDVQRAKDEVWSPFRAQWHNGMVPHVIFGAGKGYHAGPALWQCEVSPDAPKYIKTTGITQPPVAAEAVVRVGEVMSPEERRTWYREMYPRLLAWHQWFYRERGLGNGLVAVVLSWETGLDNSPPWLEIMRTHGMSRRVQAMKHLKLERFMEARRKDTRVVPAAERMTTIDLNAVYDLIKNLRRLRYDSRQIMAKHPLRIADLTLNCVLMRANVLLAEIAEEIGEGLPLDIRQAIEQAPDALESLWDEETSQYCCRDAVSGKLVKAPSIGGLLPLYAGQLPKARAGALIKQLGDPHTFGAPYPVPSTPMNSPLFNPRRYWQGPSWVNINWLLMDGLRRNGHADQAERLRRRTLAMIAGGGMYEYYSPLDGAPAGAGNFSWTAALAIDLIKSASSARALASTRGNRPTAFPLGT